MPLPINEIKQLLDQKADQYNDPSFIGDDPICVPHMFSRKEDIEIAGFLAASIAWGQRPVIIRNAKLLMEWMDDSPYDYIMNAGEEEMKHFSSFTHRTFNGTDFRYFLRALKRLYTLHGGLEGAFSRQWQLSGNDAGTAISGFRRVFFEGADPGRTSKHVADPLAGSSAKRINMFLRWMVRKDSRGVDFGIWKNIRPGSLCCPLDVHTGSVARALGILRRKANDWKAVQELTASLRLFDPGDPVKYDFALFGLGMYENF
jgi:uncharacterized protein (TIGR02757 family)